jgi:hypothetical protein
MEAKTIRQPIAVKLLAVVLLATGAFAAAADAQTLAAKFTLPFEVHWGKTVLPAGEYTMSMDSLTNVALIWSVEGEAVCFTPIPVTAFSDKGATALLVMVRGNERIVRSLNLPSRRLSLVYQPTNQAEREIFAQADKVQAVPLITAGR